MSHIGKPDKKGFYHSDLVRFGPATLTIESDPLQSKQGGSYYIKVRHNGEERYFTIENAHIKNILTGLRGQTVLVEASGSREDADLTVSEPGASPAPQQRPPARQPQRREESRIILTDDPEKAVDTLQDGLAQFANAAYLAMSTINNLREQAKINGIEMTSEQFQALTSTALISLKDQIHNLPTAPVWRTK